MQVSQTLSTDIADGFYTVSKDGLFFIFRVKPQEGSSWYDRKQVISVGRKINDTTPMISREWWHAGTIENGILTRNGARIVIDGHEDIISEAMLDLFKDAESAGVVYAQNFGRCCVCNRKLTHPESVATGIGPECAGKRNKFTPESALAEYNRLDAARDEEQFQKWEKANYQPDGIGDIPTSYDEPLERLKQFTHRHGYIYWETYDEYDMQINTIEKIEPLSAFAQEEAERRMTEIEALLKSPCTLDGKTKNALYEEAHQLHYLVLKAGLRFVYDGSKNVVCVPLPGREAVS